MSKRANPMKVNAALTYTVDEAAGALGKSIATIRNWVRDGLPVMSSRKPMLISGAAIREYLKDRYKAAKRPLQSNELTCLSCRAGRVPAGLAVTASLISPKTMLLKGTCSCCGATATRMISEAKVPEFAQTFRINDSVQSDA